MEAKIASVVEVILKRWGTELVYVNTPLFCSKKLTVRPGYRCSRHLHVVKNECFFVLAGCGFIEVRDECYWVSPGDRIMICAGTPHSFGSLSGLELLETSTHHDDADVRRDPDQPSRMISDQEFDEMLEQFLRGST